MLDITGVDLVKFAQKVYELSMPQGLGFLHFTPEPLSEERVVELLSRFNDNPRMALAMDYVDGRACKMNVFKKDGKLVINDSWYDHTDAQLQTLLETFGKGDLVKGSSAAEHSPACNCVDCQKKHPAY